MKKTVTARRTLRLDHETVRHLSSTELAGAAGGNAIVPPQPTRARTLCLACSVTGPVQD